MLYAVKLYRMKNRIYSFNFSLIKNYMEYLQVFLRVATLCNRRNILTPADRKWQPIQQTLRPPEFLPKNRR